MNQPGGGFMEKQFRDLVAECLQSGFIDERVSAICSSRGLDRTSFYNEFAKHVALEFVYGSMSYCDADDAMNQLIAFAKFEVDRFTWKIFEAFDAGEFHREADPKTSVPWQKYTLPEVTNILLREGLLPRA